MKNLKIKQFFALVLSVFFCNLLYSQTDIVISGKVVDLATKEALPFARLQISDSQLGGLANDKGTFRLRIPNKYINRDIQISYTGYSKNKIPIKNFIQTDGIEIQLKSDFVKVKEVIVRPFSPEELITLAYFKVPKNYPNKAVELISDFDEIVYDNDREIYHAFGDMRVYKTDYSDLTQKDLIRFENITKNDSLPFSELWNYMHFIDGPHEVLYSDFVKYRDDFMKLPPIKVNFLKQKHFKYYSYTFKATSKDIANADNYVIKFTPSKDYKRGVYEGEIVIDTKTLAFKKLSYSYCSKRMKRVWASETSFQFNMRRAGLHYTDLMFFHEIEFKKIKNVLVPFSIVQSHKFRFQKNYSDIGKIITIIDKYKLNDVNLNSETFNKKDCIVPGRAVDKDIENMK
jgi:hypothetical protein